MDTYHKLFISNSQKLNFINENSIDLVITSPPYPMIEMWDSVFGSINNTILEDLTKDPMLAFEKMHLILDSTWQELYRVIKPGGFVCINIGDATRTINSNFRIYMNAARIINKMSQIGFNTLPSILWRKQTNSPTKFMGSGMYPSGAYVTLEHEHILIFRKGDKKVFNKKQVLIRRESAFFWEERNKWFSDLWEFKGTKQSTIKGESRERTAAYPIELPFRLINMYSIYGDLVLDPFWGTGTTTKAAAILGRNSIGVEIDKSFDIHFLHLQNNLIIESSIYINDRIGNHKDFVMNYKNPFKYNSNSLNTKIVTNQEKDIKFYFIDNILQKENYLFQVFYKNYTDIHQ